MSSKTARRKTLSHSEIENFLSEISVASDSNINSNNYSTNPTNNEECQKNKNNLEVFADSTDIENKENSPVNHNISTSSIPLVPIVQDKSMEEYLRDYCKIIFSCRSEDNEYPILTEELCEFSRKISNKTKYLLLSNRTMFPDQYQYPSSSIESKKELLISLSPMLTNAENQRKVDIELCEQFTRCRSSKGKGRYSCYEYTDIDTQLLVDYDEFERRYMAFIHSSKSTSINSNYNYENNVLSVSLPADKIQTPGFDESKDSSSLPSNNLYLPSNKPSPQKVILSPINIKKDHKKSRGGERRITLSPATAKSMLISAIEEDNSVENVDINIPTQEMDMEVMKPELSLWKFSGLTSKISSKSFGIMTGQGSSSDNSFIPSDQQHILQNLGKELDGILANNDEVVTEEGNSNNNNNSHDDLYEARSLKDFLDGTDYVSPPNKVSETTIVDTFQSSQGAPFNMTDEVVSEALESDEISIEFEPERSIQEDNDAFELMESVVEQQYQSSIESNDKDLEVIRVEQEHKPTTKVVVLPHLTIPIMSSSISDSAVEYPSPNYPFPILSPALSLSLSNFNDLPVPQLYKPAQPIVPIASGASMSLSLPIVNKSEQVLIEELESKTKEMCISEKEVKEDLVENKINEMNDNNSIQSVYTVVDYLPESQIDEKLAKELAYNRLGARFELARWKYQWEQVSIVAANTAIRKFRK